MLLKNYSWRLIATILCNIALSEIDIANCYITCLAPLPFFFFYYVLILFGEAMCLDLSVG